MFYRSAIKMIRGLQESGTLPISRMCVRCRYFDPFRYPDSATPHHCHLVGAPFADRHLRIDCPDQEFNEREAQEALWVRFCTRQEAAGANAVRTTSRKRRHCSERSRRRAASAGRIGVREVIGLVFALTRREAARNPSPPRCAARRPRRPAARPTNVTSSDVHQSSAVASARALRRRRPKRRANSGRGRIPLQPVNERRARRRTARDLRPRRVSRAGSPRPGSAAAGANRL